jgi:poly(3-hydroxybutyrate) depolymerase
MVIRPIRFLQALAAGAVVAAALVACSDTTDGVLPEDTSDAAADGGKLPKADGSTGTDDEDSGSKDSGSKDSGKDSGPKDSGPPPINPPPGPKLDVPKTTCPVTYQTNGPVAGNNTNFAVGVDNTRSFVLSKPPASFTGPRPLIVAYHGFPGSASAVASTLASFVTRGFVVVAPESANKGSLYPTWDALRDPANEAAANLDVDFFDNLVDCTAAHLEIDSTRVYVAGFDVGGIFANRLLRSKSAKLAGGITSSGMLSLTAPSTAAPTDMFVIVAWGGANDVTLGTGLNFEEEATISSRYWEAIASVNQVACKGNSLGHSWLSVLNNYYADNLLTHPKGSASAAIVPAAATVTTATCDPAAAPAPAALPAISCGTSAVAGCQAMCQLLADCGGENRTVGGAFGPELTENGITGGTCTACITDCTANGTTADDTAALACFAAQPATCGEGLAGGKPMIDAINTCCVNRTGSNVCMGLCSEFKSSLLAGGFFPGCAAF